MPIKQIQVVGLAVVLAGVGANAAEAGDVTVSTATTTPLVTSSPDGVSAGDVTIASGGSISIDAGETAITVDSSNDVTVASGGSLTSEDANNSIGISILGGNAGAITNNGTISLTEDYTLDDTDDDGDLDGPVAVGSNRIGVFLQAGPTFTGDITSTGTISIEGNASSAIRLDALLTGDLTTSGVINVIGDDSVAIAINEGVSGDVSLRSSVTAIGEGAVGLDVNGQIDGALSINGSWSATGFRSASRPLDQSDLDADDLLLSGSAVLVRSSVLGGVRIEGFGVEDDEDDDGDGVTEAAGDTNDDLSASINVFGAAPALHIQADPLANLVIGAGASGFGLHVQGSVGATGVYDNISATAIRVEGDAGGATATINGGIALDSAVSALAFEADATALYIGENASTPLVTVRRAMLSQASSEGADTARGVFIADGANVAQLNNSSTLRVQLFGETGNAVAIADQSNTLTTINNSGTILAAIIATDDDLSDGVPPPPITGQAIAIDVSTSTIGVTFNQIPDVVFTDGDAVDDDSTLRPQISTTGDLLFGSGADTVNLQAGFIVGDIAFGAGADTLILNNDVSYTGRITDSDGALTIDAQSGLLALDGGALNITSAQFGSASQLQVLISDVPAESTVITATGAVSFAPGAIVRPVVPAGLPPTGTQTFLTAAGGLVGANNVTGAISGIGTPFAYNLSIDVVSGDPNSLEANFALKSAAELGFNTNQAAGYDQIIAALRLDDAAGQAFALLDTEFEFFDAYEDLMPSYSSAAAELAAMAVQQMQSATTNRLAATRLHEADEVSVWAQEIAYGLNREPSTPNGVEVRGQGFGLAFGIDGPLQNGALFGLSGSFITSEVEEPGRPEGEISTWFVQGSAYLGTAVGPFDLDFVGGVGGGKITSRRFVEIGDTFSALSEADWMAYEVHGAARASMPLAVSDWFVVTPQAALTYVGLGEDAYTESGGGAAIDYDVDGVFSQRLWGDVGVEFSARWHLRGDAYIAPRIFAGYRANVIQDDAERTVRFVSGGSDFVLTDESSGEGGALVGIGLDATNGYSTFSIGYEGEIGDEIERHSLNAAIRFRF